MERPSDETAMIDDAAHIARHRPGVDDATIRHVLDAHYGVQGTLRTLPSDRDANYAVQTNAGTRFVFKIAHALESKEVLEAQHAAMDHVARRGLDVSRAVSTLDGRRLIDVHGTDGRSHLARLLTFLPGVPLATVRPLSDALLSDVGSFVGGLSGALADFQHRALDRYLIWDVAHAETTIVDRLDLLDADERRLVEAALARFRLVMDRRGGGLRRSVVHNDPNDYNLLINGAEQRKRRRAGLINGPEQRERRGAGLINDPEQRVAGLIDFGDVVTSFTVADPAVAVAYAVLGADDPLRAASTVVASYHDAFPLHEDEVAVLFPMITARLCVSVCVSAHRRALEPDNAYLTISRKPALRLLARLLDVHPRLAEYVFRRDCGYEPCPAGSDVAAWCRRRCAASVVSPAPSDEGTVVFDFSTSSPDWTVEELTEPGTAAHRIESVLLERNARLGVGRYGEVRPVYRGERFQAASQRRMVHLGVDLFQRAGSPVYAPLEGTVHSVADNDRPFDYGPTVILEHQIGDAPTFYTLYGHLSRASLEGLRPGETVGAGEAFAEIGSRDENGGWAPHLHVQITADLLGCEGDFPGVAAPWLREVWMAISPYPGDLLGLGPDARVPEAG